jgi:hypothetical protein
MKLARRIWAPCVLITLCMGSFGVGGLALGFAVSLLVSLAAIEPLLLRQRFARLALLPAAALYQVWTLLSLAWATPTTYAPLLTGWSHWLMLLAAAGCMMTDEVREGLWRAFLAVQAIVALWAIYVGIDCLVHAGGEVRAQACMSPRLPHGGVVCGSILAFAAIAALLWLEGRVRSIVVGLLMVAVLLIAEPVAWIVALVGLGIALREARTIPATPLVLAGGVVAAMLAVLLVLPAERAQLFALLGSKGEARESVDQPEEGWRTALEAAVPMIVRSPFVGHGLGSWSEVRRAGGAGLPTSVEGIAPASQDRALDASSAASVPNAPGATSSPTTQDAPHTQGAPHMQGALSAYVLILVEHGFVGLMLFLGLLVSLWQAAAWLTGWEATAARMLVAMMAAGCVFQPWSSDPSAARLFLLLMLLLLSGLRAPAAAGPPNRAGVRNSLRASKSSRSPKSSRPPKPSRTPKPSEAPKTLGGP